MTIVEYSQCQVVGDCMYYATYQRGGDAAQCKPKWNSVTWFQEWAPAFLLWRSFLQDIKSQVVLMGSWQPSLSCHLSHVLALLLVTLSLVLWLRKRRLSSLPNRTTHVVSRTWIWTGTSVSTKPWLSPHCCIASYIISPFGVRWGDAPQKAESFRSSCCNFQRVYICFSPIQHGSVTRMQRCKTTKPQSPERVLLCVNSEAGHSFEVEMLLVRQKKKSNRKYFLNGKALRQKIKTVKFQKPSQPKNPGQVPFLPGGGVGVSLIRSTSSRWLCVASVCAT